MFWGNTSHTAGGSLGGKVVPPSQASWRVVTGPLLCMGTQGAFGQGAVPPWEPAMVPGMGGTPASFASSEDILNKTRII